jgi:VRR-NUC domain
VTVTLPPYPKLAEADFQRTVIDLAHVFGWSVAHFRPARTRSGWRTPVQADGIGWPDLMLLRRDRLLVVELKAEAGRLRPAQAAWLERFRAASIEAYVWRPSDLPAAMEVLR